jgi:hypothetical protein
VGEAPEGEEP